jgi:hypothetical protein
MNKILKILKSIRFQQLVIAVILFTLIKAEVITNDTAVLICQVIYTTFGISVAIGTADKFSEKK